MAEFRGAVVGRIQAVKFVRNAFGGDTMVWKAKICTTLADLTAFNEWVIQPSPKPGDADAGEPYQARPTGAARRGTERNSAGGV